MRNLADCWYTQLRSSLTTCCKKHGFSSIFSVKEGTLTRKGAGQPHLCATDAHHSALAQPSSTTPVGADPWGLVTRPGVTIARHQGVGAEAGD